MYVILSHRDGHPVEPVGYVATDQAGRALDVALALMQEWVGGGVVVAADDSFTVRPPDELVQTLVLSVHPVRPLA